MSGFLRRIELTESADLEPVIEAVKVEQRKAAKLIQLRALVVVDHGAGLFEVRVSGFPSLDWSWEGARAFRSVEESDDAHEDGARFWRGEIVGIEASESALYIAVSRDSANPPCIGAFTVQPFDFLAVLVDLLRAPAMASTRPALAAALGHAKTMAPGGIAPVVAAVPAIQDVWGHAWGILWGPPGTGKTYTVGKVVAAAARGERVLVVSTTNKATDGVAIEIGRSLRELGLPIDTGARVGTGSDYRRFAAEGLAGMIPEGEEEVRQLLSAVKAAIPAAVDPIERAKRQQELTELQQRLIEASNRFLTGEQRVVCCTAYGAMRRLMSKDCVEMLGSGKTPFTTVVLDEAGLLSRAVTGALAILAARRVLLVGDPRQLAPISRMSRVLTPAQASWVASSGLSALPDDPSAFRNVHQLTTQHRMAPAIRQLVSRYQYHGRLADAPEVAGRPDPRGPRLGQQPRTIWYVLDDDPGEQFSTIRAIRGPGNRSWVRPRTIEVLSRLLVGHPEMAGGPGLFITPFAAQAREVRQFFASEKYSSWTSSTVHAQQGAEADYVVFDTVHASSTGWPLDEWKRLVNVALSRARHQLIVVASRAEMAEPFLAPIASLLAAGYFKQGGWRASERAPASSHRRPAGDVSSLGAQIADRAALRPVLSGEQERLCALNMDGKPRLVRGVAGSGKTYVLAHWLARTVGAADFRGKAWVLYANQSLRGLLERTAADAWTALFPAVAFPTERVEFIHVGQLLTDLCTASGIPFPYERRYEYDAIAASYLDVVPVAKLAPRCDALFVDEGQDFGERTLELCFALVRGASGAPGQKPAMVFYDNAQDVYGRGTPKWSHLGLNMIGRSTVMKESFRSTRPICEFALNVALRLSNHVEDGELKELTHRRLVVKSERQGAVWWDVEFNHVDGPQPVFKRFLNRDEELAAMAQQVRRWVVQDGVRCSDIKVLVNGQTVRTRVVDVLSSTLVGDGIHVSEQHAQAFQEDERTIIVSTAHSFKGHEAEIVVVPAADKYTGGGEVLKSALYVAMTRARSLLYVSCLELRGKKPGRAIFDALLETDQLARGERPPELGALVGEDALAEVTRSLDSAGRAWVKSLASRFPMSLEPIFAGDGSILAQPTFSFEADGTPYAFFAGGVSAATANDLDDAGISVLKVGEEPIGVVP